MDRIALARRLIVAITFAALCGALQPAPPALAHPLGNFTVNRYSRLELSPERLRVRYVLDLAEIPTYQALPQLDVDADGDISAAERAAYATRQVGEIARTLELTVAETRVPLRPESSETDLMPGQAGLQTLRLTAWLAAPTAGPKLAVLAGGEPLRITFRDPSDPARIGWREIVVHATGLDVSGDGAVPVQDQSDELRRFPEAIQQPP